MWLVLLSWYYGCVPSITSCVCLCGAVSTLAYHLFYSTHYHHILSVCSLLPLLFLFYISLVHSLSSFMAICCSPVQQPAKTPTLASLGQNSPHHSDSCSDTDRQQPGTVEDNDILYSHVTSHCRKFQPCLLGCQ